MRFLHIKVCTNQCLLESVKSELLHSIINKGDLCKMEGRRAEAEKMYLQALEKYEQMFAAEHPSKRETVNNLGLLFINKGSLAEPEKMYLQALEGYQRTLGAGYPPTLNIANNLGLLFIVQGELDEAEKMYLRALRGSQKVGGIECLSIARTIRSLGRLYNSDQNMKFVILRQEVKAYGEIFGSEHWSTLEPLNELLGDYSEGKLNDAEMAYRWVLEGCTSVLQAALLGGHQELVLKLQGCGALFNAQPRDYCNFLPAAAAGGHVTVVQLLLDKGVNVNNKGKQHSYALHVAAAGGHETVVQLLLDRGAEVNQQGGQYGNALQAAAAGGHATVVHLLLNRGASVEGRGEQYSNMLQKAAPAGHQKVIKLLQDMDRASTLNDLGFSDSGYSSVFGSDPDILIVEEIASFLLDHNYFRLLITLATQAESRAPVVLQRLRPLIELYGQDLEKIARNPTHFLVTRELTRHAPCVAEAILRLNIIKMGEERENFNLKREPRIEFVQQDRVMTRDKLSPTALDVDLRQSMKTAVDPEAGDSLFDDESLQRRSSTGNRDSKTSKKHDIVKHLQLSRPVLEEAKRFMASNIVALNHFLGFFSRVVYSDPLEAVKSEFLQSKVYKAVFHLQWELDHYLKQEIFDSTNKENDGRILGSLLVLCGNLRHCFANSCKTYLKWKWPETAEVFLEALQCGLEVEDVSKWQKAELQAVQKQND